MEKFHLLFALLFRVILLLLLLPQQQPQHIVTHISKLIFILPLSVLSPAFHLHYLDMQSGSHSLFAFACLVRWFLWHMLPTAAEAAAASGSRRRRRTLCRFLHVIIAIHLFLLYVGDGNPFFGQPNIPIWQTLSRETNKLKWSCDDSQTEKWSFDEWSECLPREIGWKIDHGRWAEGGCSMVKRIKRGRQAVADKTI